MKKVLIGVGVGCGVLLLAGGGLLVAGGMWASKNFGGGIEAAQRLQTQQQELAQLNAGHPFRAPAQGELLTLDEKRLDAYLAVREEALPAFKDFEAKSKAFEDANGLKEDGKPVELSTAMQATGLAMGLAAEVRAAYISGLKKQGMSPAEFQAITTTIYASMMAGEAEQAREDTERGRERMKQQLAAMDAKLKDDALTDAQREQLEEARAELQLTLGSLEDGAGLSDEARKVAAANVALLQRFEQRVQVMANPSFDGFVLGAASFPAGTGTAQDSP